LKPKVLISVGKLNFPEDIAEKLREIADVEYVSGDYSSKLQETSAVLVSMEKVNDAYLSKAPKLGVVARFGVGYDTVDVSACTRRGVYVGYTPDVLSAAVADLTWALILGWMRRIAELDGYARTEWGKREKGYEFGWDLPGKTFGILGLGRIGTEAAKRGQGFDVEMIYNDIIRRRELEEKYGIEYVNADELFKRSDILSVHVPLLPSTRNMVNEDRFKMMKQTAILVNTSRGGVIDQAALVKALEKKQIAGAALDVFEEEPIPLNSELLKMRNVLVTPHCASATWETRRKMAERCAQNIRAYLEGKKPPFTVPEQESLTF
jgi:phosphoglycerate dehydrogenase-like enzyme